MFAVKVNNIDAVKILIENGANQSIQNQVCLIRN